MRVFSRSILLTIILITFALAAYASDTSSVPPVVVSATLSELPIYAVGSSVTVITEDEIKDSQKTTVVELLRNVPGVSVAANGATGQTTRVFLRGMESRHTMVIIDGMEVNDPADPVNAYDFAYLSTDNIERIEILRGPQSTLYGSDAVGGVINIITKTGKGKPSVNGFVEGGSYNSYKVGTGAQGEIGSTSYSVNASRSGKEGFSAFSEKSGGVEKDGDYNNIVSANVKSKLADNFKVNWNARINNSKAEYDDFGADSPNWATSIGWNTKASGVLDLLGGDWQQEMGIGGMRLKRHNNDTFGQFENLGNKVEGEWIHRIKLPFGNLVTVGAETSRENFETEVDPHKRRNNDAFYAQDYFAFDDRFFLTLGARTDNSSDFGRANTWRVAPAYLFKETNTRIKASYGTAYKAPSLFQLYSSFYGEPTLQAEKSRGYDFGFEQNLWHDKISFGSTYFSNDLTNFIDFDPITFLYINGGKIETHGLENFITYRVDTDLTFNLNHTLTISKNETAGQELLRRPRNQLTLSSDWKPIDKLQLGGALRYVSGRRDYDLSFTRTTNKPFTTLDLNASYQILPYAAIYGRVDNLFDNDYEEVLGYTSPGRSAYVGVRGEY